jgi:general secretion pathway protein D
MRWAVMLAVVCVFASLVRADQGQGPVSDACATGQSKDDCKPSKKDLRKAKSAYAKGLKLQEKKHLSEALDEFESASRWSPRNPEYATARELARQQLVFEHMERGNADLLGKRRMEAMAEFRNALDLDPKNDFARQRLEDAAEEWTVHMPAAPMVLASSRELTVKADPVMAEFHFRGDSRSLLTQVSKAYGLDPIFDDSVVTRNLAFDVGSADFSTAMQAACTVTKTFWVPMTEKQILLVADTPDNHLKFDRMLLQTFYLPGLASPKDLTDLTNLLRTMFDIHFISSQPASGTLAVRAPQEALDAARHFLEKLDDSRPQVMLDVRAYEINHTLMRNMGLQIPNQFTMFNIPLGALAALGGQNIQDLINQLIASGGINQANSSAISALLAQLQNQQNSIFSQPIATFGNGLTLMGLSLGTAGAQLSLNESWVKNLEQAHLRAAQGDSATFRIGTRFPILNATFAPIFNSPQISQVLQNNTFQAAFPSFNYEDLGLTIKAKPVVHSNLDVTVELELQFRTLTGQSVNGVPIISNREYKGTITLADGSPAVVAGSVSRDEQRGMNGIPGLGGVPGLNKIMTSNSKQEDESELLITITPHVISATGQRATYVWLK